MTTPSRTGTPLSRASSVSAPSAGPSTTTDLYRPLAAQLQRPLAPFVDSQSGTDLPGLLGLDAGTYSSRLSGKTVMLTDLPSAGPSSLVQGRKRNRGDPAARQADRERQATEAKDRAERGVDGMRKTRQRIVANTGPESTVDYATILPVHYLHVRYMSQLLGLPVRDATAAPPPPTSARQGLQILPGLSFEALQSRLVKVDLTGALLRVRAAKNPDLVGITGLVIEETAGTFRLVGKDSHVRVVPKRGSQLTLAFPAYASDDSTDMAAHVAACPQIEVDILGAAFAFRSGDRAGRKFRQAQGAGGSGWGEEWVEAEWSDVLGKLDEHESTPVPNRRRKRGKSRRKDPLAHGTIQVF